MRRFWIHLVLPIAFGLVPPLMAALLFAAVPADARRDYLNRVAVSPIDWIIIGLGLTLFVVQVMLTWRALRWREQEADFDSRPDRWLNHLSQAAEWFPLLGLIGTVVAILQTFSSITPGSRPEPSEIIRKYAPAITATGGGLYMAFINILPIWVVSMGRDLIRALGGSAAPRYVGWGEEVIVSPKKSVTRFFIPLIDVLILLFCIFLLMPFVSGENAPEPSPDAKTAAPEQPLPTDVQMLQAMLAAEKAAVARLEKERTAKLTDRLLVRVLEIDPRDGTLFYYDPDRREVKTEADAFRLIERQKQLASKDGVVKDAFFLILYPRIPTGRPDGLQRQQIERWFKDVPFGFDIPSSSS